MAGSAPVDAAPAGVIYCVNHPATETLLRCNRCLSPICVKCAIRAPVGLRCPQCTRANRSPLYVLEPQHYAVAVGVALVASLFAGSILPRLGFFFAFLLAAPAGGLIAEAIMRATRGKRGRPMQIVAGVCIVVGALVGPWIWAALASGTLEALPKNPLVYLSGLFNISGVLYVVLAVGAAAARLR